ncbi:MAG: hypothetical protein U5K00_11195 [Melioribacteraceae bacterium]|nr:hypothetical protein [Melioribacteraceae bacterium]
MKRLLIFRKQIQLKIDVYSQFQNQNYTRYLTSRLNTLDNEYIVPNPIP